MEKQETQKLMNEHSSACVTVIVPAHHISNDRLTDPQTLFNAVNAAKQILDKKYRGESFLDGIKGRLDNAVHDVDYLHTVNGIGIYISPNIFRIINFTIPVKEKVIVGDSFDWRDLLCQEEADTEFLVLAMSRKNIRLYKGHGAHIDEVKDGDFPFTYEETYEYMRPSLGSSFSENMVKSPEKDKSILAEIRMKDFIRHADSALGKYLNGLPLIIAGDVKELSDYMEVSRHVNKVAGKVVGIYYDAHKQLAQLAHDALIENVKQRNEKLISQARELIGKRMIAKGVEEVQHAAQDGMGMNLLVERDLQYPAHKTNGQTEFLSTNNAVDMVIKSVMAKKGKVTFVDNGSLKDFDGMGMLLRYNSW